MINLQNGAGDVDRGVPARDRAILGYEQENRRDAGRNVKAASEVENRASGSRWGSASLRGRDGYDEWTYRTRAVVERGKPGAIVRDPEERSGGTGQSPRVHEVGIEDCCGRDRAV